MKFTGSRFLVATLLLAVSAPAADLADLPHYQPREEITGTLRVWGNDGQVDNMKLWVAGFQKFHPGAKFDLHLTSTAAAVGAVYGGAADLSLMGREIWPIEAQGFYKTMGHDLLSVTVMTGSFDAEERTLALGVFVSRDNPLMRLTLAQVDAIFTSNCRRGHAPIRTWGDLGLAGEWADKPIHAMGYAIDSGFAFFLTQAVFKGGANWVDGYAECPSMGPPRVPKFIPGDLRCMDALSRDKYAIAFSAMPFARSTVKALALSDESIGGGYVALTKENVQNRSYPLLRDMIVVTDRAPGKPLDSKVREFLRYVLSREGQEVVVKEGAYLPLPAAKLAAELKKVE
jgi:phosphate transport system substrate-binding protein